MPVKFEAISRLGADILAHVCQQLDSLALRSPLSVKKAFISELAAWLEQLPAISAIFAGISYLSFKNGDRFSTLSQKTLILPF